MPKVGLQVDRARFQSPVWVGVPFADPLGTRVPVDLQRPLVGVVKVALKPAGFVDCVRARSSRVDDRHGCAGPRVVAEQRAACLQSVRSIRSPEIESPGGQGPSGVCAVARTQPAVWVWSGDHSGANVEHSGLVEWRLPVDVGAKADDDVIARQALISVAAAFQDRRHSSFRSQVTNEGQISPDGGHRAMSRASSILEIQCWLRVHGPRRLQRHAQASKTTNVGPRRVADNLAECTVLEDTGEDGAGR